MHWVLVVVMTWNGYGVTSQQLGPYVSVEECEYAFTEAQKTNDARFNEASFAGHSCIRVNHWNQNEH